MFYSCRMVCERSSLGLEKYKREVVRIGSKT